MTENTLNKKKSIEMNLHVISSLSNLLRKEIIPNSDNETKPTNIFGFSEENEKQIRSLILQYLEKLK